MNSPMNVSSDASPSASPKVSDFTFLVLAGCLAIMLPVCFCWWKFKKDMQARVPPPSTELTPHSVEKTNASTSLRPPRMMKRVSAYQFTRLSGSDGQDMGDHDIHVSIDVIEGNSARCAEDSDSKTLRSSPNLQASTSTAELEISCWCHSPSRIKKLDADETGGACFICWERPADAVLIECGHSGMCTGCADKLWDQDRRCPLCRQDFAGVLRVLSESESMAVVEPVHYFFKEAASHGDSHTGPSSAISVTPSDPPAIGRAHTAASENVDGHLLSYQNPASDHSTAPAVEDEVTEVMLSERNFGGENSPTGSSPQVEVAGEEYVMADLAFTAARQAESPASLTKT